MCLLSLIFLYFFFFRAVRDAVLSLSNRLDAFITLHTYSQLWIYPYSHRKYAYSADVNDLVGFHFFFAFTVTIGKFKSNPRNMPFIRNPWRRKRSNRWKGFMELAIGMAQDQKSFVSAAFINTNSLWAYSATITRPWNTSACSLTGVS